MTEVRKHQRQTASGKRTTVRHHTRSGDKTDRREDEAEAAREAWADRNAPHVSTLGGETEPVQEEWWADDDDDERYRQRAAYLESHPDVGALLTDEQVDRGAADVDDAAQRMIAERAGDEPQWHHG